MRVPKVGYLYLQSTYLYICSLRNLKKTIIIIMFILPSYLLLLRVIYITTTIYYSYLLLYYYGNIVFWISTTLRHLSKISPKYIKHFPNNVA